MNYTGLIEQSVYSKTWRIQVQYTISKFSAYEFFKIDDMQLFKKKDKKKDRRIQWKQLESYYLKGI